MSNDVIKSFLVSLGFKVDQSSAKKFQNSVEDAEKTVKILAGIAASTTIAVGAMVNKYANEMEHLFYVGQRTKSSIEGIEALQSGAERVGINAQEAAAQLEKMMMLIKTDPGYAGAISRMIGQDTNGMAGDEIFEKLMQSISKNTPQMQASLARMLTLDENTILQISQNINGFLKGIEDRKKAITTNDTAFAEAAKDYSNSWKDVYDQLTNVGHVLAIFVLPLVKTLARGASEILGYFKELTTLSFGGGFTKMFSDLMIFGRNIKGIFTDGKVTQHKTFDEVRSKDPWAIKPNKPKVDIPKIANQAYTAAKSMNQQYNKFDNSGMIVPPLTGLGTSQQPWMKAPVKHVTINQKTDINLHGDTTNQAINDINRSVADTNNATLRNLKGVVQ
jgi:hypothetical protein